MKNLLGKIMNKFSRPAPEVERPCADIEKAGLLARPDAEVFQKQHRKFLQFNIKAISERALGTGWGNPERRALPLLFIYGFCKTRVRKRNLKPFNYICVTLVLVCSPLNL